MEYKYPVSKPYMKGNEHEYVSKAVKDGWISSQGPYVKEFEKKFAEFNNVKHGVACSSGTAALTIALRALAIGEGDEVIVPEFTMIASAWAVTYTGAKPVFVDCKDDLNIDPDKIESKITPKTKAIMPVHIYGRQCDMDKIMNIAHNYNLRVIEDSAEAHGVKPVGDIACFSLYANKIISSGEGGICVTNDERLARQMEHLRGMAFTPEHNFIHKKVAYNFRMTNMQAAIALAQLENIGEILEKRRNVEAIYDEKLKDISGLKLMPTRNVLWMYDILAGDYKEREALQTFLTSHGIETRQFFKPMSQQPMYYNENWTNLRAADLGHRGIYLPSYTDLSEEEQEFIASKIKEFYNGR
ncbi:MAG: DegT/DnrJ/EryC1/StrS family aminotransferase [Nanoarchaeota archaeon]